MPLPRAAGAKRLVKPTLRHGAPTCFRREGTLGLRKALWRRQLGWDAEEETTSPCGGEDCGLGTAGGLCTPVLPLSASEVPQPC